MQLSLILTVVNLINIDLIIISGAVTTSKPLQLRLKGYQLSISANFPASSNNLPYSTGQKCTKLMIAYNTKISFLFEHKKCFIIAEKKLFSVVDRNILESIKMFKTLKVVVNIQKDRRGSNG